MTAAADGETAVTEPVREDVPDDRAAPDDHGEPDGEAQPAGGSAAEGDEEVSGPPEPDADLSPEQQPEQQPQPEPQPEPEPVLEGPPTARLAQLGITLPDAPAPVAAYVPAVRSGDLVFTSGQLPFVDGELPMTGVVGDLAVDVTPDEASALARQCGVNALAALAGVVDLDRVVRVVKVVVFVASAPGFAGQPQVANGASALFEQVFGDGGRHARSAVGVSALPLRSPVEVEVVVQVATDA